MPQTGSEDNEDTIYPESGNEFEMNEIAITVREPDSAVNEDETSPGMKPFLYG